MEFTGLIRDTTTALVHGLGATVVGISVLMELAFLDGRGRPLQLPPEPSERRAKLSQWAATMNALPEGD